MGALTNEDVEMTDIDWSKAPEWATVFIKGTCSSSFYFEKTDRYERDGGIYRLKADAASFTVYQRPWGGQGLPPVGTVCELHHEAWGNNIWQKVTVKYASNEYFITADAAGEQHWHSRNTLLRPICTPEQIAKDEREAAIDEIRRELIPVDEYVAELILDAITRLGYRKP